MNFLELHNKVLDRLRESRIVSTDIGTDPYVNSLSAHINDAKDVVENAWDWTALRGTDDVPVQQGESLVSIPNSFDNHYLFDSVLVVEKGNFLRPKSPQYMKVKYSNVNQEPLSPSAPWEYEIYHNDSVGNIQLRLGSPTDGDYTLQFTRTHHQADLENWDDILKVPSTPVFTLAHALAARERGENGGTPSAELFVIADRHLSDCIALDSAKHPVETDWHYTGVAARTNVRYN